MHIPGQQVQSGKVNGKAFTDDPASVYASASASLASSDHNEHSPRHLTTTDDSSSENEFDSTSGTGDEDDTESEYKRSGLIGNGGGKTK